MDARFAQAERNYNQIRSVCARLKSVAIGYRTAMNSDLPVSTLVNMHKGLKHLRETLTGLYNVNVAAVAEALHDVYGDTGYSLLTDLQGLGVLVQAVQDEVIALAPVSPDGSIQERTLDANGQTQVTIPVANLTTLQTVTDNLIAGIIVNG